MDWKKALALILLSSCSHMRLVTICRINSTNADCSDTLREFKLDYKEMVGYYCVDGESFMKLAEKLQACEERD